MSTYATTYAAGTSINDYAKPNHVFEERAKALGLSDSGILNSNNPSDADPASNDVVVVGGGIHSLIYAIHTKKKHPNVSVSVYEKSSSPGYKIGESALTPLGLWLVTAGVPTAIIIRLFGVKDGLAFYYMNTQGDPEDYTEFCANGPPADWCPTFQMERKISELLLTVFAQRHGVDVFHGHAVDIDGTTLSAKGDVVKVKNIEAQAVREVNSKLVVDATGRFRRFASKEARLERFQTWNTDAFWAYFTLDADETELGLRNYESCNTNHICLPEGWAWIIRLPAWEGSPIANLMDMVSYLLDLAAKDTPGDQYPSSLHLAEMFGLKFQWVISIGYALRTDTAYPADMTPWGTREAEQKFNWITARYPKMAYFMSKHTLIEDFYGPKTTWFLRKQLAYKSPKVSGDGWIAIGDAIGFTNPLFSPGINANMASSVMAAELTTDIITAKDGAAVEKLLKPYGDYVEWHVDGLQRMNEFNYYGYRHPRLGVEVTSWQYLVGQGNEKWQKRRAYTFENVHEMIIGWIWGSGEQVYVDFAAQAVALLKGSPEDSVPEETIKKVLELSTVAKHEALARTTSPTYKNNWAGLLRFYDKDLEYVPTKTYKDVFARRCKNCANWVLLRPDWLKCIVCAHTTTVEEATRRLVDADGKLDDPFAPVVHTPAMVAVAA